MWKRAKTEKEKLIKSQDTVKTDIDREKNIISEAQSNERRLSEEKNNLIDTEKKYYDLEKQTESDLQKNTEELKKEQDKLEKISKELVTSSSSVQDLDFLNTNYD